MGYLLRSLVRGSQKRTILCHCGWVVTNGIRVIIQPEMREGAQAHKSLYWTLVGTLRMGWYHEGHQWEHWVPRMDDCDVLHCLGMGMWMCSYIYMSTLLDTTGPRLWHPRKSSSKESKANNIVMSMGIGCYTGGDPPWITLWSTSTRLIIFFFFFNFF